jgi:hypothetical protein
METVFDHNITDAEFKQIFKGAFKDKDDFMKRMKIQSHAYYQIALLYDIRNDEKNYEKYLKLSGMQIEEGMNNLIS